jgi:hypothetical protein
MDQMHTDLPKTVNEALNILAYNDYFWGSDKKLHIDHHPKDRRTITSLVDSQYPWTEKQARLALVILKRYLKSFEKHNIDLGYLVDNPTYDHPFRQIDFEKSIERYEDDEGKIWVEVKFPYNKKIIQLIRTLKDHRGLPPRFATYDGEKKIWTFVCTEVTAYYLTLIAVRYDFKFIDESLLDDFYDIRKEKRSYKKVTAIISDSVTIHNASENLQDYWDKNIKGLPTIQQVDALKNLAVTYKSSKKIEAMERHGDQLSTNMAFSNNADMWIDKNIYNRKQLLDALDTLNIWPIIIPVSGNLMERDTLEDLWHWIKAFDRHGIHITNQLAWGFNFDPQFDGYPIERGIDQEYKDKVFEIEQMTKQFRYIDDRTKVYFVQNRITRTQIRAKFQPKAVLMDVGGGYYSSGGGNLKRLLDNLPKRLYYTSEEPGRFGVREIMKI